MNNDIIKIIDKYKQLINTEEFVIYTKQLAENIEDKIAESYKNNDNEIGIVKKICESLNSKVSIREIKIYTNSIFIHGNKSQIKFKYYGKETTKELGDLIFILSVVFNNKKYFEKITISQFKKNRQNNNINWDIDKEQLYFLSRFPEFEGVRGIIPKEQFNLDNYHGCLGSYNLLFYPGDFIYLNAPLLETCLANRNCISINELPRIYCNCNNCFLFFEFCEFCELCYFNIYQRFNSRKLYFGNILGFSHKASNIYDFISKYLRGCIGEFSFFYLDYNKSVCNFLYKIMKAIEKQSMKEEFLNNFFKYKYAIDGIDNHIENNNDNYNSEGGDIGIIQTIVNIGG